MRVCAPFDVLQSAMQRVRKITKKGENQSSIHPFALGRDDDDGGDDGEAKLATNTFQVFSGRGIINDYDWQRLFALSGDMGNNHNQSTLTLSTVKDAFNSYSTTLSVASECMSEDSSTASSGGLIVGFSGQRIHSGDDLIVEFINRSIIQNK